MAKKSMIARDVKRAKLVDRYAEKRAELKAMIKDQDLPAEERFVAVLKLAKLPRNGAKTRKMNRCQLTGRPHSVYRRFGISRIGLRELGSDGKIQALLSLAGKGRDTHVYARSSW